MESNKFSIKSIYLDWDDIKYWQKEEVHVIVKIKRACDLYEKRFIHSIEMNDFPIGKYYKANFAFSQN